MTHRFDRLLSSYANSTVVGSTGDILVSQVSGNTRQTLKILSLLLFVVIVKSSSRSESW